MIDQQLINMIDDPNPQVRTQAVKQLAKTKSQEAVQYLAAMYKTDTDPEIRELARKAGLYIKKKQREEQWTGGDGDPDAYDEPEDNTPEEVNVSPRAVESSKGLMDSAMNLHVAGDDEKAGEYVEKAFLANPNLQHDSYYLGLASTVLGIPGEQVVEVLLGDVEYTSSGKAKRKRKPKPGEDDISNEKVIIDLVIFWVVMAAVMIIGSILLFQWLSITFESAFLSAEFALESPEDLELYEQLVAFVAIVINAGFVTSIFYSIFSSLFYVIGLLIQYAFYHVAASTILGGNGTFKGLIHTLTNFHTVTYAFFSIAGFAIFGLFMNAIFTSPDDPTAAIEALTPLSCLVPVLSIAWWLYLGRLIGKNYEFGMGSGCLTIVIASVLMSVISGICSFVFFSTIAQIFTNMMVASNGGF